MDLVDAEDGAGDHGPQALGHVCDEGAKDVGVAGVAAGGDVEDGPEERGLGVEAFVGVLAAEDGEEGVEVLEVSGRMCVSCVIHSCGLR